MLFDGGGCWSCTSGGVFAVGVVRDVLDEALEGEGLIDSFESLSAFLVALPFTCREERVISFLSP